MKLELKNVPMVGNSGNRDNIEVLGMVLASLAPKGKLMVIDVMHDTKCPCESGLHNISHCTCNFVDITLNSVDGPVTN